MDDIQVNGNYLDFYGVNTDFPGRENFENEQEIVSFHNDSTVRIWLNYQTEGFPIHWHNAMEIIQPVENHYDVNIYGRHYCIQPGEILIIPPGTLHELVAPDSGRRFIYLFDILMIYKLKGFSSLRPLLSQPLYVTKESYAQIYDDIYQILIQIRNEYFSMTEYGELTICSLLLNLLVKFGYNRIQNTNLFPNVRLHKQKEYIQKFNELMDYIDAHYMEDLNLMELACSTGFSKYHFSRLFKQYTNYTFCDYVNNRRIKAAEEMLARPDYSITEVALQAGFPSISTFNRLFRKWEGCSPTEYRIKNADAHKMP